MIAGIFVMLILALAFVLFFGQSRKKILQQQMQAQQAELAHQQSLLYSTILTQEAERKRIAKELHDEIGSKLNVILLNLHRLNKVNKQSKETVPITTEMQTLVNTTIDTTRRISYDLLPPTLVNFGLLEAIKELVDHYRQTEAIEVVLEICQDEAPKINDTVSLNIYRVLQELMNNTMKYAKAQQISLKVWFSPLQLKIAYRDDGKGFNLQKESSKKGLGLSNIKSRLQMIQGRLDFQTADGQGVLVTLKAPPITDNRQLTTENRQL